MKIGFASTDWSHSVMDANGHPVWGGAGWARLGQYVERLPFNVVAGAPAFRSGIFGVSDWDKELHFDCDIIYMQRAMFDDIPDRILEARSNGQIIVNDIDDWYWGLSPSNGAFLASHPKHSEKENINHYRKILANSDVVTVSTPYLADRISKFVDCPIVLIRNHVEVDKFIVRDQPETDKPTVGWVGSTGHRSGDLETMKGILSSLEANGEINVHHSGFNSGHPSFADAVGVPSNRVSLLPMAAPADYPQLFRFDVGIVPLSSAPFNEAKSYIKGLEYAASGIPFVASATGEYSFLADSGIGVVAKKPQQWLTHLRRLRDPKARADQADAGRELVAQHDVSFGVTLLTKFFSSIKP
jgi:glycosyltransferase involved in cell wall biosynthesis